MDLIIIGLMIIDSSLWLKILGWKGIYIQKTCLVELSIGDYNEKVLLHCQLVLFL
jgi:hypothetical protein